MSAQPSTPQPTTPAISLATLRAVLAELKAQEPERGCCWDRAAMIVALRRMQPGTAAGYWVESECEPNKWYWVYRPAVAPVEMCLCEDYKQRGGPCKHALAVRLLRACEETEAARATPAPIPFPTERYSPEDRFELTPKGLAYLESTDPDPEPPAPEPITARERMIGALVLDGTCPTCGAIGRVVHGGYRAGCEYCFG